MDLRDKLPRSGWSIGPREGNPTGATLHYNGPPVAAFGNVAGEIQQLAVDARYHMRVPSQGGMGADGIQYHYAVLSDGTVCQLRDETAILWHCANAVGNRAHLSIHLPLGGAQAPTGAQWAAATALFDQLIARYGWAGRGAIVGHREWPRSDGKPQKSCPGPIVFRMLQLWRGQQTSQCRVAYSGSRVRQGPGQQFKQATNAHGQPIALDRGAVVTVDAIVTGEAPQGSHDKRWAHLATGAGFVHLSLLEAI
jgi:hypothetical protein